MTAGPDAAIAEMAGALVEGVEAWRGLHRPRRTGRPTRRRAPPTRR